MVFKADSKLLSVLSLAKYAHKRRVISEFQSLITQASNRMNELMNSSNNIARTAIINEHTCLSFDKDISSNISHRIIETQLDGCMNALNNLDIIQNNPKKYVQDFLRSNTRIDSANAFTNAVRSNSVYLGTIMRAPVTSNTCLTEFYNKRKECLSSARQEYINQRMLLLNPHMKEETRVKGKNKELER